MLDALGKGPRDAPARQRTLRATIEWSHRLLDAREAETFARFAAFAGGATIQAAQDITGGDLDTLERLVDKQLLFRRRGSNGDPRVSMLETVREYADEQLEADPDAAQVRERHCRHFVVSPSAPNPSCSPGGKACGCLSWTPRSTISGRRLTGASGTATPSGLRLAGLLGKFWEHRQPDH